ncbi:transposase [Archangium gephyra]|nr:transposase [Archangium gephyra]
MRKKAGHKQEPTASVLDSQSVKTTEEAETKGYDAGKKVKGRKRHLLVDTLGLVLLVWMSTADVQDRDAAQAVLPLAAHEYPSLQKTWADGAYQGQLLEVVKRSDKDRGFVVQARRWIVGRTFGWLNRERRLSKDYERKEESSEAFIYLGMSRLMLRRLA